MISSLSNLNSPFSVETSSKTDATAEVSSLLMDEKPTYRRPRSSVTAEAPRFSPNDASSSKGSPT